MLVVVFLLSLLATLGFNRLSTNNADRYYAEVCINTLYEPIASYVYAAMTSRVLTGDEIPKEYLISQKNHKFSLDYTNQSGETHSYLQLDINTIAHCQRERKYKILIPSPETKITMLPSLQGIEPQP